MSLEIRRSVKLTKSAAITRLTRVALLCVLTILVQRATVLFSAEFPLWETIHYVSEVTDVLPLDVYKGTTATDYQNWNCRYDLTYRQFRPNCALYLTARLSTQEEVLECFNRFPKMTPKEKALTCAALIAFIKTRREIESGKPFRHSPFLFPILALADARSFNDEEKHFITLCLKKELENGNVAFPKMELDSDASSKWETNLREEFYHFLALRRSYSNVTSLPACGDLYKFSLDGKPKFINKLDFFGRWRNESGQLPIEFLSSLVLVQAAFDRSQLYNAKYFEEFPSEKGRLPIFDRTARDLLMGRFLKGRRTVPLGLDGNLSPMCEGAIMEEFVKTQYIASRSGIYGNDNAISGNSSDKDVLVSDVVKEALAFLNDDK